MLMNFTQNLQIKKYQFLCHFTRLNLEISKSIICLGEFYADFELPAVFGRFWVFLGVGAFLENLPKSRFLECLAILLQICWSKNFYPLGGKIAELLPGKGPQRFIWVRVKSTFDLLQIGWNLDMWKSMFEIVKNKSIKMWWRVMCLWEPKYIVFRV